MTKREAPLDFDASLRAVEARGYKLITWREFAESHHAPGTHIIYDSNGNGRMWIGDYMTIVQSATAALSDGRLNASKLNENDIATALAPFFEEGWTARDGARAVLRLLLGSSSSAADDAGALLSPEEQQAQAARCSCHGSDDYCPCQNVADRETRLQRKRPLTIDT